MTMPEDLYYGNICPSEQRIKQGPEHAQLLENICRYEDTLAETLSEQQKEMLQKYKDRRGELSGMTERDAFRDGFVLAVRIMIEVMESIKTPEEI